MAKRSFGIFYIDANKAYFYGSNADSILQVDIPSNVVSYFDVFDKDKFHQIIQMLVTTNKIEPVPILILFSPSASYEKELTGKLPEETNTEIEQFLDSVPYEKVLSRIYKLQDKIAVAAVNKDLYEVIRHSFEKLNFSISAVASFSYLQKVLPDLGTNPNLELIANKFEAIKQYSLSTVEDSSFGKLSQQPEDTNKPNPLRLYGLIGVFVILFGVLIFMVVTTFFIPQRKVNTTAQTPLTVVTSIPTVSPSPTILPNTSSQASTSGKTKLPIDNQ